jgi:hypothetical protein
MKASPSSPISAPRHLDQALSFTSNVNGNRSNTSGHSNEIAPSSNNSGLLRINGHTEQNGVNPTLPQGPPLSGGVPQPQPRHPRRKRRKVSFFVIFLICTIGGALFCMFTSIYLMPPPSHGTTARKRPLTYTGLVAQFAGKQLLRTGTRSKTSNKNEERFAYPTQAMRLAQLQQLEEEAKLEKEKAFYYTIKSAAEGEITEEEPLWPSIQAPMAGSTPDDQSWPLADKTEAVASASMHSGVGHANQTKHGPSSTVIPQYLWFTDKTDILKTKKPIHFYKNVVKTISMYTDAFEQNATTTSETINSGNSTSTETSGAMNNNRIRVTCMDNEYCEQIIQYVSPELVTYFQEEKRGDYKADICRLAALYLHGGYYFDIDIDVIEPLLHVNMRQNQDISFFTAVDLQGVAFFQAFIAATPRHPIIKTALKIVQIYYESPYKTLTGIGTPMGPLTLAAAYKLVVDERVGSQLGSGPHGYAPRGNGRAKNASSQYLVPLTGGDRPPIEKVRYGLFMDTVAKYKTNITHEESRAIYNSTLLLREAHLAQGMYKDLPRKKGNIYCNMIVHDPIGETPYFYSRIAGSQNCKPNLCGQGHIGNRKCDNPLECCSSAGWCGTSAAHCSRKFTSQTTQSTDLKLFTINGEGWCGDGKLGNGTCPFADLCCSSSGWCGISDLHCRTYCGNGRIGNGRCPSLGSKSDPLCCSQSGWCGTTLAYCSAKGAVAAAVGGTGAAKGDAFCGDGSLGNGQCADSKVCCSPSGWCGTSAAYCRTSPSVALIANAAPNQQQGSDTTNIYCGLGHLGNGKCADARLCCSTSGWCGNTSAHCKRTECGNGITGNGQCADATSCCSPSGWCGATPAHCHTLKKTAK